MLSSSQIITTNKPTSRFFTGRMPFLSPNQQCQSTEGENITFHGLAYPKLTWGLSTLSLTTNSYWLLLGRVAMPLISPLMPVPQYARYGMLMQAPTTHLRWPVLLGFCKASKSAHFYKSYLYIKLLLELVYVINLVSSFFLLVNTFIGYLY